MAPAVGVRVPPFAPSFVTRRYSGCPPIQRDRSEDRRRGAGRPGPGASPSPSPLSACSATRGASRAQIAAAASGCPASARGSSRRASIEKRFGPRSTRRRSTGSIQEAYREALESAGPHTRSRRASRRRRLPRRARDLTLRGRVRGPARRSSSSASRGFTLTRPPAEVGDDEVDAVLERLRDERATWEPLEDGRDARDGDQVLVEITALRRGRRGRPRSRGSYRFVLGEGQAHPRHRGSDPDARRRARRASSPSRFPEDFPDEARRGAGAAAAHRS